MNFIFTIQSAALGAGLAMDAFSVSLANGLSNPKMRLRHAMKIAGTFAFFQFLMPLLGWVAVHSVVGYFETFQLLIPGIALLLLGWIGGKMIYDGLLKQEKGAQEEISGKALFAMGIATSIDALSTGFAFANHPLPRALFACIIIALVTFVICLLGLLLGKRFGMDLADRSTVFGGMVLIVIGLLIFFDVF